MIRLKNKKEIDLIREGGHILARILNEAAAMVKPGVTTSELEAFAVQEIKRAGGRPAFKGYRPDKGSRPFPSAFCISVNDEVVHGTAVPSRTLKNGDIVTLDIGMEYPYTKGVPGYFTDTALTVAVGDIPMKTRMLLAGTKDSLDAGITAVKPGATLLDVAKAIEAVLKKYQLGVIRDLVGHGVGFEVHEEPQVPNYAFSKNEFPNIILEPGLVIAIEPMATLGGWRIAAGKDGFAYVTADGSLAAHYEHTVAVTDEGHEVLTSVD